MRRIVRCSDCDQTLRAPITAKVVFHRCQPSRRPLASWLRPARSQPPRSRFQVAVDDALAEAEEVLGHG